MTRMPKINRQTRTEEVDSPAPQGNRRASILIFILQNHDEKTSKESNFVSITPEK